MILDDGGDATLLLHLGTQAEKRPVRARQPDQRRRDALFASIKATLKRDPQWYSHAPEGTSRASPKKPPPA